MELFKVVRGEKRFFVVKAQPFDRGLDGVDIDLFFLGRVGIVKAKVAEAVEPVCHIEGSGRWIWRGRCEGIRWVPGETGWPPGPRFLWFARSSLMMVSMKCPFVVASSIGCPFRMLVIAVLNHTNYHIPRA